MRTLNRKALTLAEAIVSFFLLTGAFLVVIGLFHWGLRYASQAQSQQKAVVVAENKLTEVRAWARTPKATGFNFDDWTVYQNNTAVDPQYPEYTVNVQAQAQPVTTPCTLFEAPYAAAADQRILKTSVMKVQVTVSWGTSRNIRLVTMVADPTRELRTNNPVVISEISAAAPLGRDLTAEYSVYGYDNHDNVIRDLIFRWNTKLGAANGAVSQRRDGSLGNVTNHIQLPLQPTLYTGGDLVLQARTVYRGNPALGESQPLALTP